MSYLWLAVGVFLLVAFSVGAYFGDQTMRQRWNSPEDIGGDSLIWSIGMGIASMLVTVGIGIWYQLSWVIILATAWLLPAGSFVVFHLAEHYWASEDDNLSFRMAVELAGVTLLWPILLVLGLWRGPIWLTNVIWHRRHLHRRVH